MNNTLTWIVSGLALAVGMVVGVLLYAAWLHRQSREQRRVPRKSRIVTRALVNSRERRVWRWLDKTFIEHHVMIKMPVTRFTQPQAERDREQWFALLSDIYCTFTVVDSDGKVIGCVDVAGPGGLPQGNLQIKRKLFARCRVPHWVVTAEQLPREQDIYSAFIAPKQDAPGQESLGLGEDADTSVTPDVLDRARQELKATVSRRRSTQGSTPSPGAAGEDSQFMDSVLVSDWAPDSFITPMDSRRSDLS